MGDLAVFPLPALAQRGLLHDLYSVMTQHFDYLATGLLVATYMLAFLGCARPCVFRGQVPVGFVFPTGLDIYRHSFIVFLAVLMKFFYALYQQGEWANTHLHFHFPCLQYGVAVTLHVGVYPYHYIVFVFSVVCGLFFHYIVSFSFCSAGGTRTRNCIFAPYTRLIPLSRLNHCRYHLKHLWLISPRSSFLRMVLDHVPGSACGECLTLCSYIRSMILVFTIPSNLMSLRPSLMCSCMRRLASVMSLAQTRV